MRALLILSMALFIIGNAQAADKKLTPQQHKMASCSKENKGKKGAEYKQAMSDCMNRDVAAAPTTQQQKMAACSKANKGKKGDEYKQAMSACLAQ